MYWYLLLLFRVQILAEGQQNSHMQDIILSLVFSHLLIFLGHLVNKQPSCLHHLSEYRPSGREN